ncbi:hypothetical protein GCM10023340_02530 [Nocardioides marinquilinus]|uniref:Uncharacterized protein n=1 Tax=Nocardioides marinquilinus TaxID=1210400 RepID=A0ABP9P5Z2_9ACTN
MVVSGGAASGSPAKALSRAAVVQIAKTQADRAITRRAPGLRVKSAGTATVGLSPVAYAVVRADGTVVRAASRGITSANVSLESTSAYCFRNLGFRFKTAMATPVYSDDYVPGTTVSVARPGVYGYDSDCSPAARLEVATAEEAGGEVDYSPADFTIWFYN